MPFLAIFFVGCLECNGRKQKRTYKICKFVIFAERGGFEPPIPFRGIHAFQACLFNHSSISPDKG